MQSIFSTLVQHWQLMASQSLLDFPFIWPIDRVHLSCDGGHRVSAYVEQI